MIYIKSIQKTIIFIILLIAITSLQAEPYFGGEIKFSKAWYIFPEKWQISKDTFHLIDLHLANETEMIDFKVRGQIRIWDDISANSSQDPGTMGNRMTYEIIPWEAWISIKDIPIKNMNLKAGKQYFEWGTADGIHPTSILNPDDYTDPFALNEKIPVSAVNLNYFISSFKIYLIWIPTFTPVKMPRFFPISEYPLPGPNTELIKITNKMAMPPNLPDGMGKAVKLEFSLLDIDLSAGYFHGYDYMPSVKSLKYSLAGINQFDLNAEIFFPKMDLYTFDLTTSIEGFGFWCETGLYDYNKIETEIFMTNAPFGKETVIDGKPYASYVLGTDYTFKHGFYFNLQYTYGLPYIRGKKFLEDYLILALKDNFINGLIEIELGNIFGFKRSINVKNNYELMLMQEIRILPVDDLIIGIRFLEIEAEGKVLFNSWKQYDSTGFFISYSF